MRESVLVRVVQPHEDTPSGYHQWITHGELVHANRLGVRNPRIAIPEWIKFICNAGDCAGWALIHEDAARYLIDAALPLTEARVLFVDRATCYVKGCIWHVRFVAGSYPVCTRHLAPLVAMLHRRGCEHVEIRPHTEEP